MTNHMPTKKTLLTSTESFEAAAFRVGRLTRRLLDIRPARSVYGIEQSVIADSHSSSGGPKACLTVSLEKRADVETWAKALAELSGSPVPTEVEERLYGTYGSKRSSATVEIDEVEVSVWASDIVIGAELDAWRAKHDADSKDVTSGGELPEGGETS